MREDRSTFIQGRGERITNAAALGYCPLLLDETRWSKPRVARTRGAISNSEGVAPDSKGAEGSNVQAHIAKLMLGSAVSMESIASMLSDVRSHLCYAT